MAEQVLQNGVGGPDGVGDRSALGGPEGGCCQEKACCGGEASGEVVGLCSMLPGQCGIVRRTCADGADAAYLRALGLRCNQRIRLCRAHGPWIIEVGCNGGPAPRLGRAPGRAAPGGGAVLVTDSNAAS